jgi:hypothetical protein
MKAARRLYLALRFTAIINENDDHVKLYVEMGHKHICKFCMKYILYIKITNASTSPKFIVILRKFNTI